MASYRLRKGVHLTSDELKAFRRDVAALKKSGVIPAKINSRKAVPSQLASGTPLRDYVRKFRLATPSENSATIVKVPAMEAKALRKAGYVTQGERVMVPRTTTEKVSVNKAGKIEIQETRNGITRVQIPVAYHNLEQYLEDIRKDAREINRMKQANEHFAIRLFGNLGTHPTYRNISLLINELRNYRSVVQAIDSHSKRQQTEIYQNLEIVRMPYSQISRIAKEEIQLRKAAKKSKLTKAEKRANMPEWKKEQYRARRRAEEQRRRDKRKGK